jgi:hypothetical protein
LGDGLILNDPQNIYDQAEFFAGYFQMEQFGEGWISAAAPVS